MLYMGYMNIYICYNQYSRSYIYIWNIPLMLLIWVIYMAWMWQPLKLGCTSKWMFSIVAVSSIDLRKLIQMARRSRFIKWCCFRHGKRDEMVFKRPAGSLLHYLLPLLRLVPKIYSRASFFGPPPVFFWVGFGGCRCCGQLANMPGLFRSATWSSPNTFQIGSMQWSTARMTLGAALNTSVRWFSQLSVSPLAPLGVSFAIILLCDVQVISKVEQGGTFTNSAFKMPSKQTIGMFLGRRLYSTKNHSSLPTAWLCSFFIVGYIHFSWSHRLIYTSFQWVFDSFLEQNARFLFSVYNMIQRFDTFLFSYLSPLFLGDLIDAIFVFLTNQPAIYHDLRSNYITMASLFAWHDCNNTDSFGLPCFIWVHCITTSTALWWSNI